MLIKKIDNYQLLTTHSVIDFYRFPISLTRFYRLLLNIIDYQFYQLTTPGVNKSSGQTDLWTYVKSKCGKSTLYFLNFFT